MNIAFFDFDGTLTKKDGYTDFIRFVNPLWKFTAGKLVFAPFLTAYKMGALSGVGLRRAVSYYGFRGLEIAFLEERGHSFADHQIVRLLNPETMKKLENHLTSGDKVCIVSASLSYYLEPWSKKLGVDLLCSRLKSKGGVCTGFIDGKDCAGPEKARRIRNAYDLSGFSTIFAYGNSREDFAMLNLADEAFLNLKRYQPL